MNTRQSDISSLIDIIRAENPVITSYLVDDSLEERVLVERLREHYRTIMQQEFPNAWTYYTKEDDDESSFFKLTWRMFAFIRIMDYLDHEGAAFTDGNLHGAAVVSRPIGQLRKLVRGDSCEANEDFVVDMLHLLR